MLAIPNKNEQFFVDIADYDLIKNYCWSINRDGYIETRNPKTKKSIFLHRLIMGFPENEIIDHANRNTRDNRKSNLRLTTNKNNVRNSPLRSNNTSEYTGVTWIDNEKR